MNAQLCTHSCHFTICDMVVACFLCLGGFQSIQILRTGWTAPCENCGGVGQSDQRLVSGVSLVIRVIKVPFESRTAYFSKLLWYEYAYKLRSRGRICLLLWRHCNMKFSGIIKGLFSLAESCRAIKQLLTRLCQVLSCLNLIKHKTPQDV